MGLESYSSSEPILPTAGDIAANVSVFFLLGYKEEEEEGGGGSWGTKPK
jgi:hypothetical protein